MKREPLLEADFRRLILNRKKSARWAEGFKEASALVEAKITSGELRVAKKSVMDSHGNLHCEDKSCMFMGMAYGYNFCPDCSGKIVKE